MESGLIDPSGQRLTHANACLKMTVIQLLRTKCPSLRTHGKIPNETTALQGVDMDYSLPQKNPFVPSLQVPISVGA